MEASQRRSVKSNNAKRLNWFIYCIQRDEENKTGSVMFNVYYLMFYYRLELKRMKGSLKKLRLCYLCDGLPDNSSHQQQSDGIQTRYFIPAGLLLIKTEKGLLR